MAIVDRIDWNELDRLVTNQQRNREVYSPVVSFYRWWARRPHAVAGAILDAAAAEFRTKRFLVADPFSGGGTVAFEAVRRGHNIYAQDLYPWPSLGLTTCLRSADDERLGMAAKQLLDQLAPLRALYQYQTAGVTWEVSHVLRVRVAKCPACGESIHLYRDPLISLSSRSASETTAFFGCVACGKAMCRAVGATSFICSFCRVRSTTAAPRRDGVERSVVCPHCDVSLGWSSLLKKRPRWAAVLVQEKQLKDGAHPRLREVQDGDPTDDLPRTRGAEALLADPIPKGLETNHLLRAGFRVWADLYTRRQIHTILSACDAVHEIDAPAAVQSKLQLAVLGACEMPAYLCRWERHHPKALEGLANHRYSRSTLVVETNLLSPVGRGTIPRRLESARKAMNWLGEARALDRLRHAQSSARRRAFSSGALIVTGSSERQLLSDETARLVLTDPPYHDDLQYGELARLFHAWMKEAMSVSPPDETSEAVPNRVRGTDTEDYQRLVASCLAESRRTLRDDGRLVLTFHNKDIAAWAALAEALRSASLVVVGIAVVAAENSADHCKRNKETFLCDLVIECARRTPGRQRAKHVTARGNLSTAERRNLSAIGRALAERVNDPEAEPLRHLYRRHLKAMREKHVLVR